MATAQPLTREEAARIVKSGEEAFAAADVERIVAGFTEDAVAPFATLPELRGREAIARFLRARFARQRNYRLTKTLRVVQGDIIGNIWEGTWEDAHTGRRMYGRGVEFWTMRGKQIARWEAAFNVMEEGGDPFQALGIV